MAIKSFWVEKSPGVWVGNVLIVDEKEEEVEEIHPYSLSDMFNSMVSYFYPSPETDA